MRTCMAVAVGVLILRTTWSVTAAEVAAPPAATATATNASTQAEAPKGVGVTQGKLIMQILKETLGPGEAEWFEGTVSPVVGAERLAAIGLVPDGGWRVDEELTRQDLETAYAHLIAVMHPKNSATDEPAEDGAADSDDAAASTEVAAPNVQTMTVAEMIDAIIQAVREAKNAVSQERQPTSPTRPLWR